jgi:thiaminase
VIAARRTIDKTIITEETAERFVRQLIADGVLETEEFRTYVYNDAERVAA